MISDLCRAADRSFWRFLATYYHHRAQRHRPELRCLRNQREGRLRSQIRPIWEKNRKVYGVRKVWRQMKRQGITAAGSTVERLMRKVGIREVVRGRASKRSTEVDEAAPRSVDLVKRDFKTHRPNL